MQRVVLAKNLPPDRHPLRFTWLVLILLAGTLTGRSVPGTCDSCSGPLGRRAVSFTDKIDNTTRWLCDPCADLTTVCYRCGIPVYRDYLTLSDGRVVCKRDSQGIVLDETEALQICRDVDNTMESLFGRFTSFPCTNVLVRMADRVDVRALVGVAGNDFTCPNLLGYTLSLQKDDHQQHEIRLLTGLPKGVLQSTYAHELAHAWISENVPRARELELRGDAAEGFCELIGFRVAEAYRDESAMAEVLANNYTRGQITLFIEADRTFGLADVIDWVVNGETRRLNPARLADIRAVREANIPDRPASEFLFIPHTPYARPPAPVSLEVTSILIGPERAVATINGRSFEVAEERRVPLGSGHVRIRCLEIQPGYVRIRQEGQPDDQRLTLRRRSSPGDR